MFVQGKHLQKMYAEKLTSKIKKINSQQASYSWSLLKSTTKTKVWLLILDLKMQTLNWNGYL